MEWGKTKLNRMHSTIVCLVFTMLNTELGLTGFNSIKFRTIVGGVFVLCFVCQSVDVDFGKPMNNHCKSA